MTTIYKPKSINRQPSFAGLGIFATKNIPAGTILTIDFLALGTEQELTEYLDKHNNQLRSKLYPRGVDKLRTMLKVGLNVFNDDPLQLGECLSFYNHACSPNAMFTRQVACEGFFATVVAVKDIKKREEIRIFYGYSVTHDQVCAHKVDCKGCDAKEGDVKKWNDVAVSWRNETDLQKLFDDWKSKERTPVEKVILENYQDPENVCRCLPRSTLEQMYKLVFG